MPFLVPERPLPARDLGHVSPCPRICFAVFRTGPIPEHPSLGVQSLSCGSRSRDSAWEHPSRERRLRRNWVSDARA